MHKSSRHEPGNKLAVDPPIRAGFLLGFSVLNVGFDDITQSWSKLRVAPEDARIVSR